MRICMYISESCLLLFVSQIGTGFKDEDLEQHYNFLKVKNPSGVKFYHPMWFGSWGIKGAVTNCA